MSLVYVLYVVGLSFMTSDLRIFKALADPTRLSIVTFLLDGEKCVCEIIPHAKRKQSNVSIQLRKLVEWGILSFRRDGKRVLYKICDYRVCEVFRVLGYGNIESLENCCSGRKMASMIV